MEKRIVYKVPGGKLLKIFLLIEKRTMTIKDIRITGDFFAYPEESIEGLEQTLRGKPLANKALFDSINSFIHDQQVQLIGIDARSLTDAIVRGIV
jgi:lipoate-protein ligase A